MSIGTLEKGFEILKYVCFIISDLFHKSADETAKRDYLFYLSVGYTRLKVIYGML